MWVIITKMINKLTDTVRRAMYWLALRLDKLSGSRISPNMITLVSLLGHFAVFVALINDQLILGAALIVVFGLLDALDGAMAKVQKNASPAGMLLDASSDRVKEFIIYFALVYLFADNNNFTGIMASVAALGGSFIVSYVKAKGETAIVSLNTDHTKINRKFSSGLMQYQTRMVILIVGLLVNQTIPALIIIAILSWLTASMRLISITTYITNKKQ